MYQFLAVACTAINQGCLYPYGCDKNRRQSLYNFKFKFISIDMNYNPDLFRRLANCFLPFWSDFAVFLLLCLLVDIYEPNWKTAKGSHPVGRVTYRLCPLYSFTVIGCLHPPKPITAFCWAVYHPLYNVVRFYFCSKGSC